MYVEISARRDEARRPLGELALAASGGRRCEGGGGAALRNCKYYIVTVKKSVITELDEYFVPCRVLFQPLLFSITITP